jgi:signal transduction histidine kinase
MDRAEKRRMARWLSPYPLAVQSVLLLALVVVPLSAIGLEVAPWRLWLMLGLSALHLLAALTVPARWLPLWAQIVYIALQLGVTATVQALVPASLIGYLYLAIVLQAMALFRPWLWIPLAVAAYATWSGLLITSGVLAWLQSNLALAFPATCAIIAAVFYLRQQRRSEQVQQLLQQVQQRYDSLAGGLRELQQRATQEERSRLAETVVGEVQAALSRAEQTAASALTQAQSNLTRLQSTVAQTRDSAAGAVERMRQTVAALRLGDEERPPAPSAHGAALLAAARPSDEAVISPTPDKVLTWVLPGVFIALALGLTLSNQWPVAPETLVPLLLCSALLMAAYVLTQRARHPLWLQTGLAGQIVAVVVMTFATHTLPLLLGLLLVLWQLAMRLPLRQILLYLAGVPAAFLVALTQPELRSLSYNALLVGAVATVAVGAPLLLARRQLERRKQVEQHVALLSAEIEEQTAEVRALAVASERSRLAREVHDDLGSRLMLITLQLQLADELADEDPEAALEQLRRSRELLHQAWRGVLAVADAELPLADGDLRSALERLAAPFGAAVALQPQLQGDLDELAPPVAATVYRVVQEGLTNVRKHARPSAVELHVVATPGYVTVTVTNDAAPAEGAPQTPGASSSAGSYGLVGLRERAEALGGGLEAGPHPGGGWRLRAMLPVEGL